MSSNGLLTGDQADPEAPAGAAEPSYPDGGGIGGPERGADGKFLRGNQAARTIGLYAVQQPTAHQDAVARLTAGIISDLGGGDELSTIERAYVGRLADVELTLRLLAADIAQRGLLTHRGGVRKVYDSLLAGIDRWDRLAQRLGTRRRAKHVDVARELSGLDPAAEDD